MLADLTILSTSDNWALNAESRVRDNAELIGAVVKHVARALAAGLEDICQMISGTLSKQGRDPKDVQVVQAEAGRKQDFSPHKNWHELGAI